MTPGMVNRTYRAVALRYLSELASLDFLTSPGSMRNLEVAWPVVGLSSWTGGNTLILVRCPAPICLP